MEWGTFAGKTKQMTGKQEKSHWLQLIILYNFLLAFPLMMWGQQTPEKSIELKGYVYDEEDGMPLPGAIITCWQNEELKQQALSNEKGFFVLHVTLQEVEHSYLYIRFLGYKEKKVQLSANKREYRIKLSENPELLDEVVVTGYLNQPKYSYTGSFSTVDKETLGKLVQTNLVAVLKQEIPGFELTTDIINGSNPNKIPDMILRGRSTFVEGDRTHAPLFILDGTEVDISTVFDLRPELIEQITVLKDAAATSFYGSKASNGVVVITTTPPKEGKIQIDYALNLQISVPDLSDYHLLNAEEKLEYEKLAGVYGTFSGKDKTDIERQKEYFAKLNRVNAGVNTQWMRLPLRNGVNHSHTLSFTGGTRLFRYILTGGYNEITGIMQQSSRSSGTLRANLTYGSMDKILIQYITWFTFNRQNDIPYGSFSDYASLNPYDTPYLPDGSLNSKLSFNKANPLYEKSLSSYIRQSSSRFSANLRVRSVISSKWRVEGMVSMLRDWDDGVTFYSPLSARFLFTENRKRGVSM